MPDRVAHPSSPKAAVLAWNRFFFTPADPSPLGLIRITTGLLLLWSIGCMGLDLRGFLGSTGWDDPDLIQLLARERNSWEWSFWFWVPDNLLWPVWGVVMVVIAMFTVGFQSRITAVLAWSIAVSTSRRVPTILFGFDQMVSTWLFYLAATGASGLAFSVDRFWSLRRKSFHRRDLAESAEPSILANLGLRFIQIHLCVIYGIAGLAKLSGVSWWNGSALIKLLANGEFRPFDLTGILGIPGAESMLNLGTHLAVVVEIFYPVLIWVRPLRPWVIGLALLMHLGIAVTLGLAEFSLAMATANLAFVSGAWLRSLLAGRRGSGLE